MALTFLITDAGRAALVNAANNGTNAVQISGAGISGLTITPTAAMTSLPGEYKRITTLSGDDVADDTIHLIIQDESADSFTVKAVGLFLSDGTLFGVYAQPTPIIEKTAQSVMLLAVDIRFVGVDAGNISFGNANFLNPPATTDRQGVVELATLAETLAGADPQRVPAAKMVRDAVFAWLDARFGVNNGGIWHPANDGSGSGLDADLLDGFQGSYYTDIIARLGFTPINKAGDTFTGIVRISRAGSQELRFDGTGQARWRMITTLNGNNPSPFILQYSGDAFASHFVDVISATPAGAISTPIQGLLWGAANDGSGSGLDADLLDGFQASYFTDIIARLGFTPINKAGDTFTGNVRISRAGSQELLFDSGGQSRWRLIATLAGNNPSPFTLQYSGDAFASHFVDVLSATAAGAVSTPIQGLLWGAANDGSGSGLDADLLDGQHGSYYADIPGRLGYVPVRQGGGAGQGSNPVAIGWSGARLKAQVDAVDLGNILFDSHVADVWRVSNDGAGSGLDADLLDGFQAAYFTDIIGRLGFTPLNAAAYTANDVRAKLLGVDGSGSGIDADLLDGLDASAFAKIADFIASLGSPGYFALPNGAIVQWGNVVAPASGINNVTFPIAFPNACLVALATNQSASVPSAWAAAGNLSQTSMTIGHASSSLIAAAAGTAAFWIALGK